MQVRIIHFLRNSPNHLSGEDISKALNISRAAIWKHIQELRKNGYEIEAIPHLGYKLISSPDRLLSQEILLGLNTSLMGSQYYYFDSLSSTMDEAFGLGMEGVPEGTVICAESQTKGRGRLGRSWVSVKNKGIYLSVILRPKLSPGDLSKLTLLSAVAVAEAIDKATGLKVGIKWPNDLMIRNKKVCGILTELRAEVDQMKFVVIGIGLNVNHTASQLVDGATSLRVEAGQSFLRVVVLREMLRGLDHWYLRSIKHGFSQVLEEWKTRSHTLGKRVRVTDPASVIEGIAVDLDSDGGLLIRQDSGIVIKKMSGDVTQLR